MTLDNSLDIFEQVYGPTQWSQPALNNLNAVAALVYAKAKDELVQSLTDPENQPSQFGTVTLEMHEAIENSLIQSGLQIEAWQGRYYAKEGELEQLKTDLCELWSNRADNTNATVAKLLVKYGLGDA